MEISAKNLDRILPLEGAHHADVVTYGIDIPMRYADCFAVLRDGSRVRLRDRAQLVGWSGPAVQRTFFFRAGDRIVQIRTNNARRRPVRRVQVWSRYTTVEALSGADHRVRRLTGVPHRIIGRDGSLMFLAMGEPQTAEQPAVAPQPAAVGFRAALATGNPA